MFEKYTEDARKTIFFARDEASKRDARSIAPAHLLLGALRADPEIIQRLSSGSAQSLDDFRFAISTLVPLVNESARLKELPLSPGSKEVLHSANEVSQSMGHRHIGVEHLFLGLFSEENRYGKSEEDEIDLKNVLSESGFVGNSIEQAIRNGVTSV